MTIRVVLADDQPVIRAGLRAMLDAVPDIEVVGEAHDGEEAQRLVAALRPRILLLDLVMPGPRPHDIARWVRTRYPETEVLPLSAHDRDVYLAWMMEAGAEGYLTKGMAAEALAAAIRRAAEGEADFSPEQLARARRWREEVGQKWKSLTTREREVVWLLAEGKSNREIAEILRVTENTVEKHMSNVLDKLGLGSRTEAALWVVKNGLLEVRG